MLDGRVTLVTGGGRGLGKSMTMALLAAGGRVVITGAAVASDLQKTKAEAEALYGPDRILELTADVTKPADCTRAVAAAIEHFGRLDALINNAGRGMRVVTETFNVTPVKFWEIEPSDWGLIIDINVNGVFNMTRAAMPHMLQNGFGRIVNISTSDQTMVRRGYAPYGPSKAALEAMSRCWAQEVEGTGITVNVLLPGGAAATELLPAGPNRRGADGNLLDPDIMGAPAVWLVSDGSSIHSGERFIARLWDTGLSPEAAALAARSPTVAKPAIM